MRHLGYLFASIAFDSGVSPPYANYLLAVADRLTHRQLAALALFGRRAHHDDWAKALADLDAKLREGHVRPAAPIVAELDEIARSSIIGILQSDGSISSTNYVWGTGSLGDLGFRMVRPTSVGSDLYRLMCLERIPVEDIVEVLRELGCERSAVLDNITDDAPEVK